MLREKFKFKISKKALIIGLSVAVIVLVVAVNVIIPILRKPSSAEQWPGSPESGATSRIKTIYDSLVALGLGSESAGTWGDWGAYWNRIRSSAETSANYRAQSLEEYDDAKYGGSHGAGEGGAEESSWSGTATDVFKDNRTGLYWSNTLGSYRNSFSATHADCAFFAANPRGNYDGSDPDCGNAINACGALSKEAVAGQGAVSDWYLPSEKQLLQAYIDGVYNNTNTTWATTGYFWSSSEESDSSGDAWIVGLYRGTTGYGGKGGSGSVRCVR